MEDLKILYQQVKTEKNPYRKGELLEKLAQALFESIPGMICIDKRVKSFREIDLIFADIEAKSRHGGWSETLTLVECKNMRTVGTSEIGQLESILLHVNRKLLRLGVIFTTGRLTKDAIDIIADYNRQHAYKDGPLMVYIDGKDLEEMFNSRISFKELLQKTEIRAIKQHFKK